MNYHFGGIVYALHIVISVVGALYYLGISVARLVYMGIGYSPVTEGTWMILGLVGLVFAPFLAGMYKMWDKKLSSTALTTTSPAATWASPFLKL